MTDYRHAFERELRRAGKLAADLQAERKALYAERQRSERLARENADLRAQVETLRAKVAKWVVEGWREGAGKATGAPPRDAGACPSVQPARNDKKATPEVTGSFNGAAL